jgi:hypothetical protein
MHSPSKTREHTSIFWAMSFAKMLERFDATRGFSTLYLDSDWLGKRI